VLAVQAKREDADANSLRDGTDEEDRPAALDGSVEQEEAEVDSDYGRLAQ
jgi:hypothetical protein